MKRLVASLLSFALALGAFPLPAAAQVLSAPSLRAAPGAAPAASAAVLSPAALAPALASPAALLAPAPLAAPLAAAPAPALAATLPAAAAPLPAVAALRGLAPAPSRAAAPVPDAGLIFDGGASAPALDSALPAAADTPLSEFRRPSRLSRATPPSSRPKRPAGALSVLGRGLFLGAAAAVSAPVVWDAAPGMKLGYLAGVALAGVLVVLDAAWIGTLIHGLIGGPALVPSRRAKNFILAAGLAIGVAAGMLPTVAERPIVERFSAWIEEGLPADKRADMRAVPGSAMADETMKVLSANPVGRQVLDRLRDRGGVVRLPPFFVSNQPDSYAQHFNVYGSVVLATSEITGHGWTVEQFLADPALQRQLVRDMASTIAHELTHEDQGRITPLRKEFWAQYAMEDEYEAFLVQHAYVHAELAANPGVDLRDVDLTRYRAALDDVDGFLKGMDRYYPKNKLQDLPRWREFRAKLDAGWGAHRVEGYLLLARRDAKNSPELAKIDLIKAKDAAISAGLPAPKLPKGK